jgi:hypothetical protein
LTIDEIRDIVLVLTGIVWSIVFLLILIVTLVVFYFSRKYLNVARDKLDEDARPLLGQVQVAAESLRERTAALPHYAVATEIIPARREDLPPLKLSLPFFRKRKPWYQRLLGK